MHSLLFYYILKNLKNRSIRWCEIISYYFSEKLSCDTEVHMEARLWRLCLDLYFHQGHMDSFTELEVLGWTYLQNTTLSSNDWRYNIVFDTTNRLSMTLYPEYLAALLIFFCKVTYPKFSIKVLLHGSLRCYLKYAPFS